MTGLITIIILALAWLGHETDWMSVRLLIGADTPIVEYQYKTYKELNLYQLTASQQPMWLSNPYYMEPLCGKDWLENTMHVIPECKIELTHSGVRYNMTIKDPNIMRKVVAGLKAKPARQPKITYSRNKNGGMKFSPMIPKPV